jgi:hypothetical protein
MTTRVPLAATSFIFVVGEVAPISFPSKTTPVATEATAGWLFWPLPAGLKEIDAASPVRRVFHAEED